jgi:hypothetical protein
MSKLPEEERYRRMVSNTIIKRRSAGDALI